MIKQFYLTHTGIKTPGQSGTGSNGDEGIFHIAQSSRTRASPSDGLVSYSKHLLREGVLILLQIVYSTASANCVMQS